MRRVPASGSTSRSSGERRGPEADGPVPPPLRRHPRGRPDRGGRPDPRLRRNLPADAAGDERPGRPADPRAAPAPPRRGRDARPRLRRGRQPQPHRPRACRGGCGFRDGDPRAEPIGVSNPLSAEHSVDAHDAARLPARRRPLQPRARRRAGGALRVRPRLPARGWLAARGRPGRQVRRASGRRPPTSRCGSARSRSAPLRPAGWRGDAAPADFYALKGALEALATELGASSSRSCPASSPSCTRAAPAACPRRRRGGRLARRDPPAGLPRLGPRAARRRSRSTSRRWSPPRRSASETLRGRDLLSRPSTRTSRWSSTRTSPAAQVRAAVLEGGGELLRSAEVFDLYRGEQVGEGRKSLALRLELPRRRPDPHRRGGRRAPRRRSRRPLREDRGVAP